MPDHSPSLTVTIIFIIASLVLVAINGFFVAAEFAIVKVRRTRLKELEGQGVAAARVSILMVDELDEYLSATQLGITLVSLGLGWVGEESFYNLFLIFFPDLLAQFPVEMHWVSLVASFFIITLLHVVLGELVPKSMAIQRAEQITLWLSKPLYIFYRAAKPLITTFTSIANVILRLIGYTESEDDALSEEELKLVLQDSHEDGVISESEARIISRAFSFSDKYASDIMIPEHQVQYLSIQKSIVDNLAVTQKRMYTRFPVVQSDFQNIVGVVHIKDTVLSLISSPTNQAFLDVLRPTLYIEPTLKQDKIMRLFKEKRTHIAIVRDSNRGINLGIVTLEDILEELVGDIVDEHGN